MGLLLQSMKFFVFSFNILCLLLGIVVIAVNALGLQRSLPSTDEHSFFIVGIILSSLVCMSTLIGCYGVVCDELGVNIAYALFTLVLLLMQCFQLKSYPTLTFYMKAVERVENAWHFVDTKPNPMNTVERTYFCCGLYDSRDYNYRGLKVPKSCYFQNDEKVAGNLHPQGCLEALHNFYQSAIQRERLYNWALISSEGIVFICSVVLCVLLILKTQRRHLPFQREPEEGCIERPTLNHINSRSNLLSQ